MPIGCPSVPNFLYIRRFASTCSTTASCSRAKVVFHTTSRYRSVWPHPARLTSAHRFWQALKTIEISSSLASGGSPLIMVYNLITVKHFINHKYILQVLFSTHT